jgi:hypothetical protein
MAKSTVVIPTEAKFVRPKTGSVRTLSLDEGDLLPKALVGMMFAMQFEDESLKEENTDDKDWLREKSYKMARYATDLVKQHWLEIHVSEIGELTPEVDEWVFHGYTFEKVEVDK